MKLVSIIGAAAVAAFLACSSPRKLQATTSGSNGDLNQVNECAIKGVDYIWHFVEHAGGTCGPLPDVVINTNDPQITSQLCVSVTQDHCVAHGVACKTSVDGCDVSTTYTTTFATDGSSATSTETITISCSSDGSSCSSTYDVTAKRK